MLAAFVFAGMFIGRRLPPRKDLWRIGGSSAMLGFAVSLGQLTVGLLAVFFFLGPMFNLNPLGGLLVEISMSGGFVTAAGLTDTFKNLGFAEGEDLARGLATISLVASLFLGTLFVNRAVRRTPGSAMRAEPALGRENFELSALHDNEPAQEDLEKNAVSDPLTVHLALFAVAMIIGQMLRQILILLETYTYGPLTGDIVRHLPLFPMALIGGLILQYLLVATGKDTRVSRQSIGRISGFLLDCIIVSALATVSLAPLRAHWEAVLVLAAVGIVWTAFCVFVLGPRLFPAPWFEKAAGALGQGGGGVAAGLLLTRIADPEDKSGAFESYYCRQVPYGVLLGGGLVTALSMPLCARLGPVALLMVFSAATVLVIGIGMWKFRPSVKAGGV